SKQLTHDLDLEVTDPDGVRHYPWTLDPVNPNNDATRDQVNTLDNIEQVVVTNPKAGRWTVNVRGTSLSDPDMPVQGFVLASSHNVNRRILRLVANVGGGINIPDNNAAGSALTMTVNEAAVVRGVRVELFVNHQRRGD